MNAFSLHKIKCSPYQTLTKKQNFVLCSLFHKGSKCNRYCRLTFFVKIILILLENYQICQSFVTPVLKVAELDKVTQYILDLPRSFLL